MVAPMNTRLPAVVIAPPLLGVPVWIPFAASSSKSPSGTRHAMSPVLALTATSSPHGGAEQLQRLSGSQKRPPSGVTLESTGGAFGLAPRAPADGAASSGAPSPPRR